MATQYTAQLVGVGYVLISPDPERAGPSTLTIGVYTVFEDFAAVDDLVLTTARGSASPQQQPVRHLGRGRFSARIRLARGANTVAVVVRDPQGTRLRAVFRLDVPG